MTREEKDAIYGLIGSVASILAISAAVAAFYGWVGDVTPYLKQTMCADAQIAATMLEDVDPTRKGVLGEVTKICPIK